MGWVGWLIVRGWLCSAGRSVWVGSHQLKRHCANRRNAFVMGALGHMAEKGRF